MRVLPLVLLLFAAGPLAAQSLDPNLVGRWVLVDADSLPAEAAMAHAEMHIAADGTCGMLSITEPILEEGAQEEGTAEPPIIAEYFDAEWDASVCTTADGQILTERFAPLDYALEGDTLRIEERSLIMHLVRTDESGLDPALAGLWEVESATQNGAAVPMEAQRTLLFRPDGTLVQAEGDRSETGRYFTPEDFFIAVGESGRVVAAGRYALDGGALVIRVRGLTMRMVPEDMDLDDGE